ncbi:hypothetical protein E1211_30945 [Micromonospora sp. 15K316]|uniref:hypothetical protein n=1 Tax=Micromonospora sp. 15K316 TaxID=2530376 RepID=UPI0010446B7D|nr:hypothetical protein [Micromonospora sp. 15K316]TDC25478.1 hypothetical protein E1211_30945 [Micromonospora sp. 15K316]
MPAPRRRSRSPLAAIAAAGLVLVLAVGVLLALDDDRGTPSAAGTANSTPHSPATSAAPKPPSPSTSPPAPPTTEAPEPLDLRQLATEFVALLVKAQAQGQVDRRTADDLRDELADLIRGKPKDRAKHVKKLRERIDEAAERDELSSGIADRLDDLLERVEVHVGRDDG